MKRCPNPACASLQFPDEANFCPNCAQRLVADAGAAQAAPAPADDGLLGGRFKLGARFGGTRTGELHDATDTSDGSACVVKLVHPHVFPTPLLRQRSEREIKQLERVQAATVARVLGHGKQGDRMWVATEKVNGQPLKVIVSEGVLTVDRAKGILLKIGEALAEAAKVGVIHRDVSPKNVLVGAGDSVKVINFGIPTPLDERVQGEPEFLSPEQVEGKPVDQRSNIYSLGAIFYYVLTGRPPYVGDAQTVMKAHLAGNLTPPSQFGAVPPNVEAMIKKALDRTSSKRFMTLRQLLTEVERVDATAGTPGAADSASQTTPFAAGGAADLGAAKTMMGMLAPGQGPIGPDGKPTDVVQVGPGAAEPPTQPVAAVSTFAPPSAATPVAAPTPQPVAAPTPQAVAAPTPQAVAAPTPQAEPQALSAPRAESQPAPSAPAPSVPAPSVPAPTPSPAASQSSPGGKRGKAKAAEAARKKKGQFRETLWFKKGELDAVAAEAAAAAKAQGKDELAQDKADSLPMEDRYKDDGSVSVGDQQSFSLRTGHTQMMSAVDDKQASGPGMGEDDLINEMKSGSKMVLLMILGGLCLVVGVVLFFVLK